MFKCLLSAKSAKFIQFKFILVLFFAFLFALNSYFFFAYRSATIEEIIFAFHAPTGKLGFSYISPILYYFLTPFVFIVISYILVAKFYKTKWSKKLFITILTIAALTFTTCTIVRLHVRRALVYYYSPSSFIENNYIAPNKVKIIFPEHKRNLIHIYLESVELTFTSKKHGGNVNESIIPELEKLALKGESFSGKQNILSGAHSLFGSTWTMGAAFSTETGLPLKVIIKADNQGNDMGRQPHFFPNIIALGDILEQNGYNCVVMKDVDMTFAGSENFYREHGNNLVMDYKYCSENGLIPEGYSVWAGFEDKKLFEIAKKTLTDLSNEDKPFSLTFYTNDTHFPDGYLCESCPHKYDDQYSNVYACSSSQLADFINWIQNQPFYKNTTIVIHGDHPTMNETYSEEHGGSKDLAERKVFTTFINSAVQYKKDKTRNYSSFDLFPTIIASLGAEIEGNRLGLGTNIYSDTLTLIEKNSINFINKELAKRSFFMEKIAPIELNYGKYNNESFGNYLSDLIANIDNDKTIVFAVKGEATKAVSEQLIDKLHKLGIQTDLTQNYGNSFISIISDGKVFEESSKDLIEKKISINNLDIECVSGGISGNQASIILNNKEYSKNKRGINVVVYDHKLEKVISSESFDTHISQ
ncbi:sulfatase-like hydrolase/transferase [Succinivibrio dextrinosolvens]|uniref:sulfatase-like hydrolase/transferase n=1 Tax=Succinivibrio dextrinosolvens TaxID=83771 RepID=UPI00068A0CE8|nr:sulfatase-like hydrolase/transferase [Succinivibrio dextrinosolvens]